MTKSWKFYLAGKEHDSGEILEVRSPYNNEVVGTTFLATGRDLEDGVFSAEAGFLETKKLRAYERAEILLKIRDGIQQEREAFARLISEEAGKPLKDSRAEVNRCVLTFTTASEEAKRIGGEFLDLNVAPAGKDHYAVFRRFPIGPVLCITPFNFPLNLVAHKIAPCIAVGTSFVLKPASATPLSALKLAEVIVKSGYPEKAVNVLPCTSQSGENLAGDERFKLVSFTGSPSVGWKLKAVSGKKKVVLELGGNAGVIVDEDADTEYAALRCAQGGFSYSGQSCISVQRIFVHRKNWKKFLDSFLAQVEKIVQGDPLDEKTDLGPMINEEAAARAESWIGEAVAGGAKLLAGGKRSGAMLAPTVLTDVSASMKVSCQEAFAPLVTVAPFDDFNGAIEMLNDSWYGLQAGVFTNRFDRVMQAYEALDVGGVLINEIPSFRMDSMPYGGVKDSGLGREGVKYAMEELTEGKLLVLHDKR